MSSHDIRLFITVTFSLIAAFSDNIFPEENHKKYKYFFGFTSLILAISLFIM